MQIDIHGKNMDTGESLQEHIRTAITAVCQKYFGEAIHADVVVTREGGVCKTSVSLHVKKDTLLQAEGSAKDPYDSVKDVMDTLEKQMRRLKRKITSQQRRATPAREALAAV